MATIINTGSYTYDDSKIQIDVTIIGKTAWVYRPYSKTSSISTYAHKCCTQTTNYSPYNMTVTYSTDNTYISAPENSIGSFTSPGSHGKVYSAALVGYDVAIAGKSSSGTDVIVNYSSTSSLYPNLRWTSTYTFSKTKDSSTVSNIDVSASMEEITSVTITLKWSKGSGGWYRYPSPTTTLRETPSHDGYGNDGKWYDASENVVESPLTLSNITSNKIIALHTTYTAKKFNVHFSNESTEYRVVEQTYNTNYKLPENNPTKEGYKFDGWWTEATGGTPITNNVIFTQTSEQTLYARWSPYKLTINYYDESSILPGESTIIEYSKTSPLHNAIEKQGFKFRGWLIGTTLYQAGENYTNNETKTDNKSISAIAQWQPLRNIAIKTSTSWAYPVDIKPYQNDSWESLNIIAWKWYDGTEWKLGWERDS